MSFAEMTIGQLEDEGAIIAIQDGNHGEKHPKANEYVETGVPFIMASDLRNGYVDISGAKKLPQSITDRLRIGFARGGDILLTHKGSVGYVAVAPDYEPYLMLTPQVTYYRVDERKLSGQFLKYAFLDPMFQKRLAKAAGQQGTRGYVGIRAQRQFKISYCESILQKRVVAAIKPYDDLIENNRRRIALLEEAARLLYREWFVHFRFPGHEHANFIDDLPEGWQCLPIDDVTSFLSRGISPAYDDEAQYLVVNQKCVRNRVLSLEPARRQKKEFKPDKALQFLDVLINSTGTGTLGRVAQCWLDLSDITFDSHVTVARPDSSVNPYWFGYAMMGMESAFEDMGEGATNQKELAKSRIAATTIVVPRRSLQDDFGSFARSTSRQIQQLTEQNQKLAQARDLLLPRLMSGELAV